MRSSKSRSRSKNNRNRPSGNIINRVFDSSGPEGKVRGTPSQVIEKYNQLARDAQLSGDRVATENFQQHAEHYTRMLAQAQREMDARRDQQSGQQGGQGNGHAARVPEGREDAPREAVQADGGGRPNRREGGRQGRPEERGGPRFRGGEASDDPRGTDPEADDGSGLVPTPEADRAEPSARPAETPDADVTSPSTDADESQDAAKPAKRAAARPRARAGTARTRTRAKAPVGEQPEEQPAAGEQQAVES